MSVKQNEYKQMTIEILSANENNHLDEKFIGDNHVSLALKWTSIKQAASYAVVMIDYEATSAVGMSYVHWYAYNIKNNYLEANASQTDTSLVQGLPTSFYLDKTNNGANRYVAPYPPNKSHRYEIRVYALANDIAEQIENLNMEQFDKLINQAGIIGVGMNYVVAPQLKNHNNQATIVSQDYATTLFKNQPIRLIHDVEIDHLWLNIFTPDMADRLLEKVQCAIKIEDAHLSGTPAYGILITSNIGFTKTGSSTIHYAHIVNQKNQQHLKFVNSYQTNPQLLNLDASKRQKVGHEFAIIADNNYLLTNETYLNISVFGLDSEIEQLNKTMTDASVTGFFDVMAGHVVSYLNKYIKVNKVNE
ncbi:YbhB/YbcL family Raf kinase inhibitor-like protein [Ureaplasma miroungigenitalium]|uniref:YbhB/YbcL family Raf kinase inhibitor-like protein n=1 Tax=Ureaplasma miroungigenitalium TaxID=1042321 RepID=A0ABT3BN66_9BACT|nr:YbhB/YbcL family Raf kinase inhibitor-like protein [Ureaplasma miroungigenitalium]MCV3728705.1 YbhB/YbcL family Raf kinase inhibitor-like protein [Ureaplasma miroungigenitalium]MCV3734469.1 YbhB/YbcL family Raf kinase inhibitor-like protein [Ureaplasma miroungigenitalium]